jgi:hypothetical protein
VEIDLPTSVGSIKSDLAVGMGVTDHSTSVLGIPMLFVLPFRPPSVVKEVQKNMLRHLVDSLMDDRYQWMLTNLGTAREDELQKTLSDRKMPSRVFDWSGRESSKAFSNAVSSSIVTGASETVRGPFRADAPQQPIGRSGYSAELYSWSDVELGSLMGDIPEGWVIALSGFQTENTIRKQK